MQIVAFVFKNLTGWHVALGAGLLLVAHLDDASTKEHS